MKRLTKSKLYLDSSYAPDFTEVQGWLNDAGYAGIDGQTTNPSYFTKKNPEINAHFEAGERFAPDELMTIYRETVEAIHDIHPGDTSVEVYADHETSAEDRLKQARDIVSGKADVRIKLPIIPEGMKAAAVLCEEVALNMTVGFTPAQAAAVHSATKHATKPVIFSAFIGRLTDRGENGIDNLANVNRMYREQNSHVEVIAASFRDVNQVLAAIKMETDILTINYDRFKLWHEDGFSLPDESFEYVFDGTPIPFEEYDMDKDWESFNLYHDLTEAGVTQFAKDWNSLLK